MLSREIGQTITIIHDGEKMQFTVTEIRDSGRVRMGFDAPKSFVILRNELEIRTPTEPESAL